jgi:lipoprotein-anchoring transpeptidase ErfK/SrfK
MATSVNRRDFLKLCALGMSGLAFRPYFGQGELDESGDIARVAIKSVSVYSQPNDKSEILYQRYRDDLVNVYYEVNSTDGPGYNPIWYRVWRGYIHSGHMQRVKIQLNPILSTVDPKGQMAEVTVPFSQTYYYTPYGGWQQLYRLYYSSVHWIVGIDSGPDGQPWYRLHDELNEMEYFVQSAHMRVIDPKELEPISPEVPMEKKRIEVSIARQMLTAYENNKMVLQTRISTGVPDWNPQPDKISTETPKGTFHVQSKMPSKHMGDGHITNDLEAYELPGVPWVSFFEPKNGVAFHGTYWHTNFGTQMSHGCVNMRNDEAKWLFRWVTPVYQFGTWEQIGYGTLVEVS